MAGLTPTRKSLQEIEKASERLLKEHRAYLQSWMIEHRSSSGDFQKPAKSEGKKPKDTK